MPNKNTSFIDLDNIGELMDPSRPRAQKETPNTTESLTPELHAVVADFVESYKHKYNVDSPQDRADEFARSVLNKFDFPYDIKNYLDKATARKFKQKGFKRALSFIELRSNQVAQAFSMLPEPWSRLDTEYKRARLADELTGRARMHLADAVKNGLSPFELLMDINKHVGLSMWVPAFEHSSELKDDDAAYAYILNRAIDDTFWLRVINKAVIIAFESARRAAGMVSPHVSPYASFNNRQWFKERQKRQAEWIEKMALESADGEILDLKDVRNASIANPANRRNELMARIRGCQEYADSIGFVALFVTLTAPGKYHRLKKRGKYFIENENWNGEPPVAAHHWISAAWEKFRSAAGRETKKRPELNYFGMRVVEPHVDGTPHWHAVFFVAPAHVDIFTKLLVKYQTKFDADELVTKDGRRKERAIKARVDVKKIDRNKGDAVAYIAKYISKNIDGFELEGLNDLDAKKVSLVDSIVNVTSWSRAYCFRQFQFQKTPSVTVWRELRRIKVAHEAVWFEKIRVSADCGCFASFFYFMGGYQTPQSERPLEPSYTLAENKYQEVIKKIDGLRGFQDDDEDGFDNVQVFTREKVWKMVKKGVEAVADAVIGSVSGLGSLVSAGSDVSRFPRSSVSNCTQIENDENKEVECRFTKHLRPNLLAGVTHDEYAEELFNGFKWI
ncbi:replication endonuclease [Moritella sp.]|uniref:replication endonuclease n=1 Tax=Moritella sp. TaxID=78556 RepID=UPI001D52726B|nr:replication endonuclease [Moritella sp.]MCJ8348043.1 replication endonuclease [Moritella sp.]NQZ42634.1 replication endonuclease [Moritella sp.]